ARDGVAAVGLYGVAGRCSVAARREGEAAKVDQARARLEQRIQEDYRTHRLKLERALEARQGDQALVQSRHLLALVAHLDHPYTEWVINLERRLAARSGGKR